jgi:hypothetical protein
MSERRGLLSRVKNRLSRIAGGGAVAKGAGIGPGFGIAYEEDWNELVEQVDNYTQKVGAAVVQTWEVGAAEMGNAVRGLKEDKAMIERFSDALVPTLTPFQDLHKKCSGAMQQGFGAGVSGNSMAAATRPLVGLVDGLGDRAFEGWTKTATYLEPMFALCRNPEESRDRFLAFGPELAAGCAKAQAVLQQNLDGVPNQPRLWGGICDSFDAWQLALTRELEISMTRAAKELVKDVREGVAVTS